MVFDKVLGLKSLLKMRWALPTAFLTDSAGTGADNKPARRPKGRRLVLAGAYEDRTHPGRLFAVRTGFEDREAHQHLSAPMFSLMLTTAEAEQRSGGMSVMKFELQAAAVALSNRDLPSVAGF